MKARRIFMTGKTKDNFDLWEADRDHIDAANSYRDLLTKAQDYARKRKLGMSSQKNRQHGGDPLDIGAVNEWQGYPCYYASAREW